MPKLNPMNALSEEERQQAYALLNSYWGSTPEATLAKYKALYGQTNDPYAAWTSPDYQDQMYSNTMENVFAPHTVDAGGMTYDPYYEALLGGNQAAGASFMPLDYIAKNAAHYKAIDPSFDITKLKTVNHPVLGPVVLPQDLPQLDQTNGEMLGEMLKAAGIIGMGAMGISAIAGAHGMPGIGSLLDFGAPQTTGADAIAGGGGSVGGSGGQFYDDWGLGSTGTGDMAGGGFRSAIEQVAQSQGKTTAQLISEAWTENGVPMTPAEAQAYLDAGGTGIGATDGGGLWEATQQLFSNSTSPTVSTAKSALGGTLGKALGAVAGAVLGGLGGSQEAGKITTTNEPWAPSVPYLTEIMGEAKNLYGQTKDLPQEAQQALQYAQSYYGDQLNNPLAPKVNNFVSGMMNPDGSINSPFARIQDITAPQVNFQSAMAGMGGANPTDAIARLLSGQVDNPYLDSVADSITGLTTRNLMENVMPGINSGASAAGQFGGSRQGIAQGLAVSRMNQDLGASLSQLYGGAYENAQNRMGSMANSMAGIGTNIASQNANNQLAASQFNANLGLQQNQQDLSALNSGMNWANTANDIQNKNIQGMLGASTYGQDRQWQQMNNYGGLINNIAGRGGSSSQPYFENPYAGLLGGAISGWQMGGKLFGG